MEPADASAVRTLTLVHRGHLPPCPHLGQGAERSRGPSEGAPTYQEARPRSGARLRRAGVGAAGARHDVA